jgi:hypothetical protein
MATPPAYSRDPDPSDFYLFDHVKCLLRGESFETDEDLLSAVEVILRTLEKSTLSRLFLEWMTRLERYIETNGDHVGSPKIHFLVMIGFKRHVSRSSLAVEHPIPRDTTPTRAVFLNMALRR